MALHKLKDQRLISARRWKRHPLYQLQHKTLNDLLLLQPGFKDPVKTQVVAKLLKIIKNFFSKRFSIDFEADFLDLITIVKARKLDARVHSDITALLTNASEIGYSKQRSSRELLDLSGRFKDIVLHLTNQKVSRDAEEDTGLFSGLIDSLMRRFLSEEKITAIKADRENMDKLQSIIDKTDDFLRSGTKDIDPRLGQEMYELYVLLPQKKRRRYNAQIMRLFRLMKKVGYKSRKDELAKASLHITGRRGVRRRHSKPLNPYASSLNKRNDMIPLKAMASLKTYVKQMTGRGFSQEAIRDRLLKTGWDEEAVDTIFHRL